MTTRGNLAAMIRMAALALALLVLGLVAWAALFPHHSPVILGFGQGYPGGATLPAAGGGPQAGVGPVPFTAIYLILAAIVLVGILWVVRTREKPGND